MLNIIYAGGNVKDKLGDSIKDKYDIKASFEYIQDIIAFLMQGISVELDKIIIFSPGIEGTTVEERADRLDEIQEAIIALDLKVDLYIQTNHKPLYDYYEHNRTFKYRQTNLLFTEKLFVTTMVDLIEGNLDKKGLHHPDFVSSIETSTVIEYSEEDPEEFVDPKEKFPKPESVAPIIKKEEKVKAKEAKDANKGGRILSSIKDNLNKVSSPKKPIKDRKPIVADKLTKADVTFSGILVVSGDRQSGITTTVANLGSTYAKLGLKVLCIDLDLKRRNLGNLFRKFITDCADREFHQKSIGTYFMLNNPTNIELAVSEVEKNLFVVGLTQDTLPNKIGNKRPEDIFTSENLAKALTYVNSLWDIVIIDAPLETLKKYLILASIADSILLTSSNTTPNLSNLFLLELEEVREDYNFSLIMNKAFLLLTKYNSLVSLDGEPLTPSKVKTLLEELDEDYAPIDIAGKISLSVDYEKQFHLGKLAVVYSPEYEEEFKQLVKTIG